MIEKVCIIVFFLIYGLSTAQTCPTILTPLNGETNVSVNTLITWTPTDGAAGYYLLVGTTPGGRDIIDRLDVGNSTEYQILTEYPPNTVISVKITIRFLDDRPDQTCPFEIFTTGNSDTGEEECTILINAVDNLEVCDTDADGHEIYNFDLDDLKFQLVGSQTGLEVTYYDINGDSLDLTDPIELLVDEEFIIRARVTNQTNCFIESAFSLT
ncbi:MAG: hypothetical protein HKN31_05015, partial [Pricia sp.]|nr:hypothetical protein [Pricia sp.]